MRKHLAVWLVLLSAISTGWAQANSVTAEISTQQEQFLPGEEINVAVRITNFSGQPLNLGAEDNWITFHVEALDRFTVEKHGSPSVVGEFTLESSKSATKRVNIAPHFDMQKPGRYQIVARVKIPQWKAEIVSRSKTIDVVRGARLRVVEFGVPSLEQESPSRPEVRKFILQQADYQKEMRLYLRLTDVTESRTLKLYPIARTMSFSRPEMQLDRFNNAHVLHQSGQHSFSYCVMNAEGQVIVRQTFDYAGNSRPRLQSEETGRISVRGGQQRVTESDVPPPDLTELQTNAARP